MATEITGKKNAPDFIIIDDDFINNVICRQVIQSEMPAAKIDIYTNANKGLEYINTANAAERTNDSVLFLDINMPALNGWDILEMLNDSPVLLKQQLKIFLLSSSVPPEDKQKANDDPMVCGYIEKPLTLAKFR